MTSKVEVRFARVEDGASIAWFLKEHWRENHVFVTEPALMHWQHLDPDDSDGLNLVMAVRQSSGGEQDILGLLGFIPFRRFNPASDYSDVSLAIWRVRDDAGAPGLGVRLLKTLEDRLQPTLIASIGISQMVRPIYSLLRFTLARMSHAALFSTSIPERSIASGVEDWMRKPKSDVVDARLFSFGLDELDTWRLRIDELGDAIVPRKSAAYLRNRFFRHPYYEFNVQGVEVDGTLQGVIVMRRVPVPDRGKNAAILRIVDVVGDDTSLKRVSGSLQELVDNSGCQYVDIVHYGLDSDALDDGGFVDRDHVSGLILPNYFEPFVAKNIDIDIAFRVTPQVGELPIRLMRADSDQDRPNVGPLIPREFDP